MLDAGGRERRGHSSSARRLKAALAGLEGCFYGLSRPERRVIILRAGLRGRRPHSRTDLARRFGTSPGQVRRVERRAVRKLYGLVRTDGCAAGGPGNGAGSIPGAGLIGPAELAAAPALIAFGNPAFQAARQVDLEADFSRRGELAEFPSPSPGFRTLAGGPERSSAWAFQLLTVMLLVALIGFMRTARPAVARARANLVATCRKYGRTLRPGMLASAIDARLARVAGKRANGRVAASSGSLERAERNLARARLAGANGNRHRANGKPVRANGRRPSPSSEAELEQDPVWTWPTR